MMPDTEHGREMMLRLARGDMRAFEEIVVSYERAVRNFAFRYLGDERKAEDVAQETFLRVYKARARWRPDAKFHTWLFTITSRLCLNAIRSQRRERRVMRPAAGADDRDALAGAPERRTPSPAEGVLAAERAELLRRAVAELSENQRRALLLHRFEGLSYQEVAEAMGLTLEAVRSLLVRARRNLHDRLAPLLRADEPAAEGDGP
ncbi:MAG TPA: RNA polymerase subunit sigma-70 [Planctomycetes bacterium]|nr:RNA polymerase subunit sigma-70 [Planctomycetota bacterium]